MNLDDMLDSVVTTDPDDIPLVLAEGEIDPRLKLLSYSSLLTLHSCPRKFQLYRMSATEDEMDPSVSTLQTLTFAYGHAVGDGIQMVLMGASMDQIFWKQYLAWYADLADYNPKQQKSFYLAMAAIQKFKAMKDQGYLEGYELATFKGRPAVELSFRITFPDGYTMRGSVDAVLVHVETGEVLVLECKTSSLANLAPAAFKNSSQGTGYSVVLDSLFEDLSSYKVLYLVYKTKAQEYEQLPFIKSYLQRATWIQELLLDIETIKLYEGVGVYPMRGENCYDFFRECEYLNVCTLSTSSLTKPATAKNVADNKVYDVELTMNDLIMGQLKKNQAVEEQVKELGVQNYNPQEDEIL